MRNKEWGELAMGGKLSICGVALGVLVFFWASLPLRADITGTILGVVTDPSGAAVPGVQVTLENPKTGFARTATTDTTGSYEFLAIPIGEGYVVGVDAKGFEKSTQTEIKLLVNQKFRADFQLVVGSVTQQVQVTASPVQAETTSTQLGDVIDDRKMTSLPLNGRSYLDLLGLQVGVVPETSGYALGATSANVSVNGQRETANSFLVNGGDVMFSFNNGAAIVPTLDSIQEFRMLTNSFDAEYGRFSGAIVNVITKSGTNDFHGTLFEFLRNDKLDSRNFFDFNQVNILNGQEIPGSAIGAFKQNQFGYAVGGPIVKNKLFFFTDYQGTRQVRGLSSGNLTVPSSTERAGDFSDVGVTGYPALTGIVRGDNQPGVGSMNEVLTQRLGYTVTSGEPYWVQGCNTQADAQAGMCVFPNQVIPQAAWDPVAKATLKFVPVSNLAVSGKPYWSSTGLRQNLRDDKFAGRIDLNHHATGNWSFYYHGDDSNQLSPGQVPGFPSSALSLVQQANVTNTHIFGPTTVNEFHLNFTRSRVLSTIPEGGLGTLDTFGFQTTGLGIIDSDPKYAGLPLISLGLLGVNFGASSPLNDFNNIFQVSDNLSHIAGRHTLKFGGEFRYLQFNVRQDVDTNGSASFVGGETGNDFADYLIGATDYYGQGTTSLADNRGHYGAAFAQDSFKVKPNFTVNYGLRWEVSQPWYDRFNRVQAFDPGVQSVRFPDSPTGWVFPGDPGIPRTLSPTRWGNLGPRLGIAYSPGFSGGALGKLFGGPGKTSVRAASGIYYTSVEESPLFFELGDVPFGLLFHSPGLVYLDEPFKSRNSSSNPGQRFPFIPPPASGSDISFQQWLPISGSTTAKIDNVLPYAEHFNFNLQREITRSMILTLGYVGTAGHHLVTQIEANPGNAAKCLQIRALYVAAGEVGSACGPYGEDTIYNIDGMAFNGTRPYSVTSGRYLSQGILDFGGTLPYAATLANSSYNALQATLEKRVGDLRLLAAYTWSKALDNSSSFYDATNPYNNRLSKSLSAYDMTHNFVASYSYELPFQKITHASTGGASKLLRGWELSGITRFTTGLAYGLTQSGDYSLCACGAAAFINGVDMPNYSGQPIQFFNPRTSPNHEYFSPTPFSSEVLGVPGNANRRFFHGPGINNWNIALHKTTHINERTSLEFRAEFFNLFDHAQFLNPSSDFASPSFGIIEGASDPRIGQMALKLYF
jgi:carboxypeptidase family protein